MIIDNNSTSAPSSIHIPAIVKTITKQEQFFPEIKIINNTNKTIYYAGLLCGNNICNISIDNKIIPQELEGEILNGTYAFFPISIPEHAIDYPTGQVNHYLENGLYFSSENIKDAKNNNLYNPERAPSLLLFYNYNSDNEPYLDYDISLSSYCYNKSETSFTITYTLYCLDVYHS